MANNLKKILRKEESSRIFLKNITGNPEIVLVMPVTRSEGWSTSKWEAAIEFVECSEIKTLILVDKTKDATATEYFLNNFNLPSRNLYILPRSISESHYESLGSIKLDKNLWLMQLHDDDEWTGHIKLPEKIDPAAAYYSRFFIKDKTKAFMEENDFSYPARINFVLTPAHIWNKFACIVEDQKFHVAGSMDSTLNLMVQLSCKFVPIPSFSYFYDNHNWASRRASRISLLKLTEKDGWSGWASIEIALLSRQLDNLSCLSYVAEFVEMDAMKTAYKSLMLRFKPRLRRKVRIRFEIFCLKVIIGSHVLTLNKRRAFPLIETLNHKLSGAIFISKSWSIGQLPDVIELVRKLQIIDNLSPLQSRFQFWQDSLTKLDRTIGV